jgi:Bacterial Ig-like domain
MQPNDIPSQNAMDPGDTAGQKKWFIRIAVGFTLAVILLVIALLRPGQLQVTGTNPDPTTINTTTPFLKVTFNHQLSGSGLSVSSQPSVVTSSTVSGNTLTINLNQMMSAGTNYTVTINSISDTSNGQLTNKVYSFTPTASSFANLPTDQQNATLQQQQNHPPSKANIGFVGTDALLNDGVTLGQENDLEQAFFNFEPDTKAVVIDTTTITPIARDPNSADPGDSITFAVTVDNHPYNATINYSNVTVLQLLLVDQATGKQVFDSGNIDSSK